MVAGTIADLDDAVPGRDVDVDERFSDLEGPWPEHEARGMDRNEIGSEHPPES